MQNMIASDLALGSGTTMRCTRGEREREEINGNINRPLARNNLAKT